MHISKKAAKKWKLIIALEGIDGAGKTTLINAISIRTGNMTCVLPRTEKSKLWSALLNCGFVKRVRFIQAPLYIILSWCNYIKHRKYLTAPVLLMDRCFLSNICYYYPSASNSTIRLRFARLFEIKINPNRIFIIDEQPEIAYNRDNKQKDLSWLTTTRNHYLDCETKETLSQYNIIVLHATLSVAEKEALIYKYISDALGL